MEREEYSHNVPSVSKKKRSNKNDNVDKNHQRRFSDEQIRFLESMFESETKLEPRKKVQVARELGLQPRQVAIWFQNKRARWKSKQIEQDFITLRAQYETLASQFESLKQEKQSLILQLEKLNELLGSGSTSGNVTNSKSEVKDSLLQEGLENGIGAMQLQPRDDNTNKNVGELKQEGIGSYELQNTSPELGDHASLGSLESWYRSFDVFDQPRGFSQSFNFWS